jgi:hypothetical protein
MRRPRDFVTSRLPIARAVAVAIAVMATRVVSLPAAAVSEYDLKAAYLYNFTQFVTWPATAFPDAGASLRICIAGDNPFGPTLANTVRNETAAGHPVEVATLASGQSIDGCHIVFVPPLSRNADTILAAAKVRPVLTVGDAPGFLEAGGIVRFVVLDGRVRFDVNVRQAAAAGLALSSRLLQVARQVQR